MTHLVKFLSLSALGFGVFILMQLALPLLSYKLWELTSLPTLAPLIDPVRGDPQKRDVLGISVFTTSNNFPALSSTRSRDSVPSFATFTLSVPKLEIFQAEVIVDSNDIDKSLAHLPGTPLPGEKGNVFISGHSAAVVRPKLNDPYKSIFNALHNMRPKDKIAVTAGGQTFNYQVIGFKMVSPYDMSVVEPPDPSGRYISLMTCVPPGINTKRLVVLGRLE